MKTISAALQAHIRSEVTTLATCWKTTLRDGAVFGFTDHVSDLQIDGLAYVASSAYSASAVETQAGLTVDNLEALGFLSPEYFNADDVRAGRWDYADVEIFMVNWADLSMGTLPLRKGTLGEVSMGKTSFRAELRGLTQKLTQASGRLHLPACDADLGDARCKVDLDTFPDGRVAATVVSVASRRIFSGTILNQATAWFDGGVVAWTAGANVFYPREVKTFVMGGAIELQDATPYDVAVGDTFTIQVGCDKNFSTCKTKFNNTDNFRGFPHLPGTDRMVTGK
jgi:uncharacterized phage protein (TIGR02218 family)